MFDANHREAREIGHGLQSAQSDILKLQLKALAETIKLIAEGIQRLRQQNEKEQESVQPDSDRQRNGETSQQSAGKDASPPQSQTIEVKYGGDTIFKGLIDDSELYVAANQVKPERLNDFHRMLKDLLDGKTPHLKTDRLVSIRVAGNEAARIEKGLVVKNNNNLFRQPESTNEQIRQSEATSQSKEQQAPDSQDVQYLDEKAREVLAEHGIESERVEAAVAQASAERVSIVLVINQQLKRSEPVESRIKDVLSRPLEAVKNYFASLAGRMALPVSSVLGGVRAVFNADRRSDIERERDSIFVAETVSRLLNRFGKVRGDGSQYFEGRTYTLKRDAQNQISIAARDGRGEVFSQQEGRFHDRLSASDIAKFRRLATELDRFRTGSRDEVRTARSVQAEIG